MKFQILLIFLITLNLTSQSVKQIKKNKITLNLQKDPYLSAELQTHKPNRSLFTTDQNQIKQDQTHQDIGNAMLYEGVGSQPLDFNQNLHSLEQDLNEHRKHSVSIISSEIKAAAISVYIANSVLVMKHGSEGYSERVLLPYKGVEGLKVVDEVLERRLVDEVNGVGERLRKERDLLKVASKGKLFDVDLDDVYDIGKDAVENFKREIRENDAGI